MQVNELRQIQTKNVLLFLFYSILLSLIKKRFFNLLYYYCKTKNKKRGN